MSENNKIVEIYDNRLNNMKAVRLYAVNCLKAYRKKYSNINDDSSKVIQDWLKLIQSCIRYDDCEKIKGLEKKIELFTAKMNKEVV